VDTTDSSAHAHTSFATDPAARAGDPFAYAGERAEARCKRARAITDRSVHGLALFTAERERIHSLGDDLWAVPSKRGGSWRVNLADETCGCEDFRYNCTDQETGEPLMACYHVSAAAIARAKTTPAPEGVEAARRHYPPNTGPS
jgi:hypothetical protein